MRATEANSEYRAPLRVGPQVHVAAEGRHVTSHHSQLYSTFKRWCFLNKEVMSIGILPQKSHIDASL